VKNNPKKEILLKFGQRVKQLRKEQKITQSQLAFESELSREQISRIEREGKNVYMETNIALSIGFGITLKELFDFEYEQERI
jgi:transcriptional regulator with XRE-family HTH domain